MQPFPLNQLAAMADKQTLACVAGTIVSAYQAKRGTNANGEWSIQNVVLKGDDGTEVTLWMKDREEIQKSAKGQRIILTAHQGDKGLSGLYIMDDEYNGKTTRKIKVTPSAELSYGVATQQPAAASYQQAQQTGQGLPQQAMHPEAAARHEAAAKSWDEPAAQPAPAPTQHAPVDQIVEARRSIMQIANLHLLCAKAVAQYEAPAYKRATGADMTESMQQGACASIFIESCRNGLHRSMPTSPMD